jgi:hypothetical protein
MKVKMEFRRKKKDIYGNIPDPVFWKEELYEVLLECHLIDCYQPHGDKVLSSGI